MRTFDIAHKRQLLSRHFLFSSLSGTETDLILALSSERRFKNGQVIFQKGDPGSSMLVVLSGRVRISVLSEDGKEVVLSVMEPGHAFGEISLLDEKERSADATALDDCVLLSISRNAFIPFLERHPKTAIRLLAVLCDRVRKTNGLVEEIVFLDLPGRLARLLLRLADTYGRQTPAGVRIEAKLSQKELGSLIATSRESINKQLRTWHDEGIISVEHGQMTILDRHALEQAETA